jgi:hypothetical protein
MGCTESTKGRTRIRLPVPKVEESLTAQRYGTPCVRCGEIMFRGQKLHLDHSDNDRTKLLGFSHSDCNIRAAARKARRIQLAAKRRTNKPVHRW